MKRDLFIFIIWLLLGILIYSFGLVIQNNKTVYLKNVNFDEFTFEKDTKYIIEKEYFEIIGDRFYYDYDGTDFDGTNYPDTSMYIIKVKNTSNQEIYMVLKMLNDYGFEKDYSGFMHELKESETKDNFIKELNDNYIYENYYAVYLDINGPEFITIIGVSISLSSFLYIFFAIINYVIQRKEKRKINDKI